MKNLLRRLMGYGRCPICGEHSIHWVKDPLLFPDEPPIFGHHECINKACLARSEIKSTPWADKIAQGLGYDSFEQALDERVRRSALKEYYDGRA